MAREVALRDTRSRYGHPSERTALLMPPGATIGSSPRPGGSRPSELSLLGGTSRATAGDAEAAADDNSEVWDKGPRARCTGVRRLVRAVADSWAAGGDGWLVWSRPPSSPKWDFSFGPLLFILGETLLLLPLLLPCQGALVHLQSPWWGLVPSAGLVGVLLATRAGRVPSHFGFGWPGDGRGATLGFWALLLGYACIVVQGVVLKVVDPAFSLSGAPHSFGAICFTDALTEEIPFLCNRFGSLLTTYLYMIVAVVIVGAARYKGPIVATPEGPVSPRDPAAGPTNATTTFGSPAWNEMPFAHILPLKSPTPAAAGPASTRGPTSLEATDPGASVRARFHEAVSPVFLTRRALWHHVLGGTLGGFALAYASFGPSHVNATPTTQLIYLAATCVGDMATLTATLLMVFRVSYEPMRRVFHSNNALKAQVQAAAEAFRVALYSAASESPLREPLRNPTFDVYTWSLLFSAVAVRNRELMGLASMAFTVLLV